MEQLLKELRCNLGNRHLRLCRADGQEAIGLHAIGRNGNWRVVMTPEVAAGGNVTVLRICSTLPLTVDKSRRAGIAELVATLNGMADQGRFDAPDASGRVRYRTVYPLSDRAGAAGLRMVIERHVATVDRNLPSFFAVASGGQTPTEAVDQMERMRRFG
jgi:hypothetical protein